MIDRQNTIAMVLDDHKMFADSFSSLLDRMELFRTVSVFNEEKEAIQFLIKHVQGEEVYFFVDYYLKDRHSIPLINEAKRLIKNLKIIVISSISNPVAIQHVLSTDPGGFLSKTSGFDEVLTCLKAIASQRQFLSPFIANILEESEVVLANPFTAREIELLQYFDQGWSISDTADKLFLSKHTIVSHRRRMMAKAKCNSIVELLAFSRKRGLI